jgi:hypothetical protein
LEEFRKRRPVSEIKNYEKETGLSELLNPDFSKIKWPDFSDINSEATRSSN